MKTNFSSLLLALFVSTVQLSACGGGGGGAATQSGSSATPPVGSAPQPPASQAPPPWPNQKIGGLWIGASFDFDSNTPSSSTPSKLDTVGLISEDGRAYFIRDDWTMYWGDLTTDGKWVEGAAEGGVVLGAKSFGHTLRDGSTSATGGTDQVAIDERQSLGGDIAILSAAGNRWWASLSLRYEGGYDDDSSLSTIAGNYSDPTGLVGGIHGGVPR